MNTVHGFLEESSNPGSAEPIDEGILLEQVIQTEPTLQEILKKRLANLLSVKSLVTLTLTCVFAYQAVTGTISQDFITIYAVIIAFYFGTQSKTESTDKGDAK